MSARPKLRTPLSVLLNFCGPADGKRMSYKELGALIGKEAPTVEKYANGERNLPDEVVQAIYHETGVSINWLLGRDAKAPPVNEYGEPYTHESFELAQAEKKYYDQVPDFFLSTDSIRFYGRLRAMLSKANANAKYHLAAYKLGQYVDDLSARFGEDISISQSQTSAVAAMKADCKVVQSVSKIAHAIRPKFRSLFASILKAEQQKTSNRLQKTIRPRSKGSSDRRRHAARA